MNRKGFTLIELLAVIVILATISVTAVVGINASLEKRDAKDCNEQKELAKNSAKIYFSLNNVKTVSVDTLIKEGYLNEDKVNRLDKTKTISNTNSGYVFNGDCK